MLSLIAFIVGIFVTDSLVMVRKTWKDDDEFTTVRQDVLCYWGSLHRSMLSLYAAITGGQPWRDLLQPLMSEVGPWTAVPFLLYITFCVFGLRNIATGVFCSHAASAIDREDTVDLARKIHGVFHQLDADRSGLVTWPEFRRCVQDQNPEVMDFFNTINVDPSEARHLFDILDFAENGHIDIDQFAGRCAKLRGPAKAVDIQLLMDAMIRTNSLVESYHIS